MSDAADKLAAVREELEALKSEAALKLRSPVKRGEKVIFAVLSSYLTFIPCSLFLRSVAQPFDKTNPYHLRRAFGDLDPMKLVRCYKRPLRHVRFEDEVEHPLKTNDDGVWLVKTAEVPPKILIRDSWSLYNMSSLCSFYVNYGKGCVNPPPAPRPVSRGGQDAGTRSPSSSYIH